MTRLDESTIDMITEAVMEAIKNQAFKTMPAERMFGPGNVSMMNACDRDVVRNPLACQVGDRVGYHYTPKKYPKPIIGNGVITDTKIMANGDTAFKVENRYNTIWVPSQAITTISRK